MGIRVAEVDNSSSLYTENNKKYLSSMWMCNTMLDDTSITVEAKYFINFTESGNACILMEETVSYLLMLQKHIRSKKKALN